MSALRNAIKKVLIFLIKTYQLTLSPRFSHGSCRFTPTCSQYALEAIEVHGIFKGFYLGVKRIFRCHPWGGEGYDPVPPK